jgi:hypothetical protein
MARAAGHKAQVTFRNGMRTRCFSWPGEDPANSTIRSILFREIKSFD